LISVRVGPPGFGQTALLTTPSDRCVRIPAASTTLVDAAGWHSHCVTSGSIRTRERTAMFGLGIVGVIILLIVILWLLGYIG
jgi:hypothetical protein